MTPTIYIALLGWLLVTMGLFAVLPPARAVVACLVGGYLFLPNASITFADGTPPWTKDAAVSFFTLLCAIAFAPQQLRAFKSHWLDWVMILATVAWGVSSLTNGLGLQTFALDLWWYVTWAGVPYFLGRLYLNGPDDCRDLAVGIVIGTLIYTPLVLFEARFYPQLSLKLYGLLPRSFANVHRWGGYRPSVFMPTGLALALWMSLGAMLSWAIYLSRAYRNLASIPVGVVSIGLSATAIICKGAGAIILAVVGTALIVVARTGRCLWLLHATTYVIVFYLVTGASGILPELRTLTADVVSALPGQLGSEDRAGSLRFRFDHEAVLASRARERSILGWGGWGQNRVDEDTARELLGKRAAITDGFWIIVFGQRGAVGLFGTYCWMLAPAVLVLTVMRRVNMARASAVIVIGLATWSALYAADLLLNAFVSPVQALVSGALIALVVRAQAHLRKTRQLRPSDPIPLVSNESRHRLNSQMHYARTEQSTAYVSERTDDLSIRRRDG